ncbi:MAG TPA: hypothetical protein VGR89_03460, partial [Puia sp.]|nr:hypothetical protein [Puia sp.]
MKKIALILLGFLPLLAFAQYTGNTANAVTHMRYTSISGVTPTLNGTIEAGLMINSTDSSLYVWTPTALAWRLFAPTLDQVLNAGATLTANRTIAEGVHGISITGTGGTTLAAPTWIGNFLEDTTTASGALGAGAGTSPSFGSNNGLGGYVGKIDIVTGTSPTASATVLTITMNSVSYGDAVTPVILSPANAAAAALTGNAAVWADAG